jgi:hypothetical protein
VSAAASSHDPFLRLHVETQINNWIFSFSNIPAFITGNAASKFAVKGSVKEAVATFCMALPMPLSTAVQLVYEELVIFMCVLLLISS